MIAWWIRFVNQAKRTDNRTQGVIPLTRNELLEAEKRIIREIQSTMTKQQLMGIDIETIEEDSLVRSNRIKNIPPKPIVDAKHHYMIRYLRELHLKDNKHLSKIKL